ncbi:MAG: prepilin-type N-terminal cleavage/methylation domain-containing protein [Phycisphaerales bacterium]
MARHRGFTLVEIMVSVIIIAMMAALTIPFMGRSNRDRLSAAGELLASDMRYARLASMASPQDPVVVRFNANGDGWILARASTPSTPIVRSDTGAAWSVVMGQDRAASSPGVKLSLTNVAASTIAFSVFGAVKNASGTPRITFNTDTVQAGQSPLVLEVTTATGEPLIQW